MNRCVWERWFLRVKLLLRWDVGDDDDVAAEAALRVLKVYELRLLPGLWMHVL